MSASAPESIDRLPEAAIAVLEFWFGARTDPRWGQERREWFRKDAAFDAQVRTRFGALIEQGLRAELDEWTGPWGTLAHIILLDQFPRHVHRGDPRAFAGDALALALARQMVARRDDEALPATPRVFAYMPFEHAEDLAMQNEAVRLFSALAAVDPASASSRDYAERHQAVIARFGRFPHRNAVLGRASTPEEVEFLSLRGSRF